MISGLNSALILTAPLVGLDGFNIRISMFDRLTMKQSEADDQVLFIRKGNSLITCVCLLLLAAVISLKFNDWMFSANQKRVETESQIKKIKEDLAKKLATYVLAEILHLCQSV